MGYSFHKMNKEVLSFDCRLDSEKIIFNHYIMRKVNLNNMKNELDKNHFKISTRTASSDLNMSVSKAHRILKELESLNIIKCIKLGDRKGKCSIYKYITDEEKDKTVFETIIKSKVETVKYCDIDNLEHINEIDNKTDTITHSETSNGDRKGKCSIYKYITDEEKDKTVFETIIKSKVETVKYCDIDNLEHINEIDNKTDTITHSETSNIENINKEIYINVIDYLNKKSNKRFKYNTNKTMSCIRARLNEGFELEDFYKVIDTKVEQWLNTDMEKFIRPATLFSNKFEGYLNEKQFKNDKENMNIKPWNIEFEY